MPANKRLLLFSAAALVIALFASTAAWACPFCNPSSGVNEVKAGIFNDTFWMRAAAVAAPFPVFAGIIAFIYYGPGGSTRKK